MEDRVSPMNVMLTSFRRQLGLDLWYDGDYFELNGVLDSVDNGVHEICKCFLDSKSKSIFNLLEKFL